MRALFAKPRTDVFFQYNTSLDGLAEADFVG